MRGAQGDRYVIQLTPYISSPWPRLFLKSDPDALFIRKVKAHTPWAPKSNKELRINVGDVIGVTMLHSAKLWRGEVFNRGAKHDEGDFAASLVRALSAEELDDLLVVSKNGWLQVNGKRQFVVLHGGQLFLYARF